MVCLCASFDLTLLCVIILFTDHSVTNPTYSTGMYDEIPVIMQPNPSYTNAPPELENVSPPEVPSSRRTDVTQQNEDENDHEYEDIIDDIRININRNPSYTVHPLI